MTTWDYCEAQNVSFLKGHSHIVPLRQFHRIRGAPPDILSNFHYNALKKVCFNRKLFHSPLQKLGRGQCAYDAWMGRWIRHRKKFISLLLWNILLIDNWANIIIPLNYMIYLLPSVCRKEDNLQSYPHDKWAKLKQICLIYNPSLKSVECNNILAVQGSEV